MFGRVSVVLVISTLLACTVPRTALVIGAATTIAGGAMIASIEPVEPSSCASIYCPPNIGGFVQAEVNAVGYLLGGIIVAAGVGVMLSGAIGLAQEHALPEPTLLAPLPAISVGTPMPPAPMLSAATTAATLAMLPPTGPSSVLRARAQVAARSARCDIAVDAARKLEKLDATMHADLIEHDRFVVHCLAQSPR